MKHAPFIRRRSVLLAALGLPAAAIAAALAARRNTIPSVTPPPAGDLPASGSYHETEHIRKYYRSAGYF